mgnify:CR=1 FL=1
MESKFLLEIIYLVMVGVGLSSAFSQPGPIGYRQAKLVVERYLQDNNYTLDVQLREESSDPFSGLTELSYSGAAKLGPIFRYTSQSGMISIGIGFDKNVRPSSTVQDLQGNLSYVALDRIPMPGFIYPFGWDIYPQTPTSSFKEGVKIVSYDNGIIHYKVDTTFFAIYGVMRGLKIPADAAIPRYARFQVRRNIHGLIDVNMPLLLAAPEEVAAK